MQEPSWLLGMRRGWAIVLGGLGVLTQFAGAMGWIGDPEAASRALADFGAALLEIIALALVTWSAVKPNGKALRLRP